MKAIRLTMLMAAAALAAAGALAQGGPGAMGGGPAMQGAGPGASAPGTGPRMRGGRGPGPRWGADFTHGWALMTPAERTEHQQRMRSIKTYEECKTYMEQHREQMAARAKEKGKALTQPRRDACAGLKP
jgi:hypothetical protein